MTHLLQALLLATLPLMSAWEVAALGSRRGQPTVLGEILVGLLLGPPAWT